MTDLIDTTEMYLRTILELEEENIIPLRARISERLGHSGPTVSQTIARMERDGLVIVGADRHLELTEEGRALAIRVLRKHRLAERLLALLGNPTESPYGTPIPGLAELGLEPAASFLAGVVPATDARGEHVVRRLGEPVQHDIEGLAELQAAGVMPGARVAVTDAGARIRLSVVGGAAIDLPVELAQHVYLEA